MTAAVTEAVHFGLVELDLLAAHAGTAFPFPLRIPSFGRIDGEREVLLGTAGATLEASGLADENGPTGIAADVVAALRHRRGTVDLVVADGDQTIAAVAMVCRSWALICRQRLDDELTGMVRVWRVPEAMLADELFALVPECPAARSMPITLPAYAVDAAAGLADDNDREHERRLRALVRDCGGDPAVLDQLAGLLSTVIGRGQVGATRGSARIGAELSWLDGPRGRVRINRATGWVSVNPLRHNDLRLALSELAMASRGPR
ncbi:EspG family protein [Amycolatopsis xylanica]|uniref:EspG family protein n=1 Tax=Amycolatopsis xylanica TaxID=589385 RepID=A0A1H2TB71_9PSEU|nr:ESX secretion-associated protein EspG [Amycolatopsis xylanica]SDW40945.1 EspG family protein [Amycolatopsis xylanica]